MKRKFSMKWAASAAFFLCALFALLPATVQTAQATGAENITVTIDTGTSVTLKDTDGDGAYEIGTADELYAFAAAVNGGNTAINGELTADIVVNENVLTAEGTLNGDGSTFRVWTPIGNYDNKYTGTFDGNGHTVSGLYFNDAKTYGGLFGYVATNGTVQKVGVVNSCLCGNNNVGGVVGYNDGTVTSCHNTGTVTGNYAVGGVVGTNTSNGNIFNCCNTGAVSGSLSVGGVVGENVDNIINCYNTGAVSGSERVGGVVGSNVNGNIINCYNTGAVSGSLSVGGVAGETSSFIQNCYNIGTIVGWGNVGGVVGANSGGTVMNCYYLTGCAKDGNDAVQFGIGSDTQGNTTADAEDVTTGKSDFSTGEVAYWLWFFDDTRGEVGGFPAGNWGQAIGTENYPVFGGDQVYYGYTSCAASAEMVYTNNNGVAAEKPAHGNITYANKGSNHTWTCGICGDSGEEDHVHIDNKACICGKKITPVVTAPEAVSNLTYTGAAQNLVAAGSTTGGTMQYSLNGTDYSTTIPQGTAAGDYTVYYKVVGDANHNDSAAANVTVTIGKASLTIKALTQGITYGTSITQGTSNVTVTGLVNSDTLTGITLTPSIQDVGQGVITPSDATISGSADNYDITYKTGSLTISTASATPKAGNMEVTNGHAGTYTFDLSKLLPDLDSGKSYGTVSYEVTEVSLGSYFDSNTDLSTLVSGSTLTLPIQAVSSTEEEEVGTITVEITSGNYIFTGTATITVNAVNKEAPQGTPTLTPASITYGQALSTIALSGTMTDTQGNTVSGTFTWDAPDTVYTAGTHHAAWTFAPSDTENYLTVHQTSEITVNKATITITAKNQSIYVGGTVPDLSAPALNTHYTVTGLVGDDTLGGAITMEYQTSGTPATPDTTKTGTYDIVIDGATVPNANYSGITFINGTLTVSVPYTPPSSYDDYYYPSTPSTPPAENVTIPGTDSSVKVEASIQGDKATVDEIDLSQPDAPAGDDADTGTVTIDFSGLDSSKDITTVEIPSDVVKQIAAAVNDPDNDAHSLEIVLSDGMSIEFDAVALGEKVAQADGKDITISIEHHEDAVLTNAQKDAVGDRPAYDINVTSGGKHISDMGGKITVSAPYELKNGEKPGGLVVYYVDDHGNRERCETRYDEKTKRVSWKTDHLSLYMIDYDETLAVVCDGGQNCPIRAFSDADPAAWYHDGVHYCVQNGLMNGLPGSLFGPSGTTTRAQIVTILWRLEGEPVVNYLMQFEDVVSENWYTEAIRWAAAEKIVEGYNGLFYPDDAITREQMAAILWRYARYKGYDVSVGEDTNILSYPDAFDISEYAIPAMQWACGSGLIGGIADGDSMKLAPSNSATRAQVATILWRFCENVT